MDAKARLIVLDVETYRTRDERAVQRVTQEILEKRPAQNTRVDVKAMWDTEEARVKRVQDALERTSVDVLLAEVLCVSFVLDPPRDPGDLERKFQDETLICGTYWIDESEAALLALAGYWDECTGPETVWVGHNVCGFDLRVLLNGWRRHRIRPPKHFPSFVNGRWLGRVYDTMLRTPCANGLGFVSLEDSCAAYRVRLREVMWGGEPVDGSRVGEMYQAGETDVIQKYCMDDVVSTADLYMSMTCGDKWGTWDAGNAVAEAVSEIEGDGGLTPAQKALAIMTVLDRAGLVPRVRAA
jgi:hypothetical protein